MKRIASFQDNNISSDKMHNSKYFKDRTMIDTSQGFTVVIYRKTIFKNFVFLNYNSKIIDLDK